MEGLSELLTTADELYGLLPEAFTAARDERVRGLRRDGSRSRALAVKELRRPSVAAWLVNALVRHRRTEVEQLLQLGEALREAQANLDSDQLRDLDRRRQAALTALGRQARALARELGRPVSGQVIEEVGETLRAALTDPTAANAVRAGRLTATLRYAGFGGAGFGEAETADGTSGADETSITDDTDSANSTNRTDTDEASGSRGEGARDTRAHGVAVREAKLALRAAEEAARHAEGAALVAEQHRDGVQHRARTARDRLDAAHSRVAELESMLVSARAVASMAAAAWAPVYAEADAASARAEAAGGVADRARAMLESARAHLTDVEREGT
jgi:hypothetical protein